jgi:hypothetical protein
VKRLGVSGPGQLHPDRRGMSRRTFLAGGALAAAGLPSTGFRGGSAMAVGWPPASAYSAEVPAAWFELALDLVRTTPGFRPPVASRAFGYAGVALYEAVVRGMPGRRSLVGPLNGLRWLAAQTASIGTSPGLLSAGLSQPCASLPMP